MDDSHSEFLEEIRQQFNFGPYPRVPIEASPNKFPGSLYPHSVVTSYYHRNQKFIDSAGQKILDVGCGTGYTSLILAEANPGAEIVGIDISDKSIELARQRLDFHKFENVEFHVLDIEKLDSLGCDFDYINCADVLYLIPQPERALRAMKSVLKENGIIRANLHNAAQRHLYYHAQKLFSLMGLMDKNPEQDEITVVKELMTALDDNVVLKAKTWHGIINRPEGEGQEEGILANYLLRGDRGYTIPELFGILEKAELEFIDTIDWRHWDLMSLFKDPDNLPVFLAVTLPEATAEDKLQIFNLLNPVHRLLDFWCGHPGQSQRFTPVNEWTEDEWNHCTVYLHPQLRTTQVKEELNRCLEGNHAFPLGQILPIAGAPSITVDITVAACLFPLLLESPQPLLVLLKRWQQIRPLNLLTLSPLSEDLALTHLRDTLTGLEDFGYLLLESDRAALG